MTGEMVVELISGCRAVRLWDRPSQTSLCRSIVHLINVELKYYWYEYWYLSVGPICKI